MSEERHLPAGQKAEFYSRYRIPDFAAVSRIQGNYETRWTVRVHLDVELGPDWKREKEFLVLPSRGRIASDEEE